MRLAAVLPFVLLPFASATPTPDSSALEPRAKRGDAAGSKTVLADIASLTKGIKTLNATLNTFMPDAILTAGTALKIQQETSDIEDVLKKAIADTKASKPWNENQASRIGIRTLSLVPQIQSLLRNTVQHKKAFQTVLVGVDLSKMVESSLVTQRALTKQFGAAVKAKLTPDFASLAPATTQQILGYFDKAINAFKSCQGILCVPGA